MNEIDELQMMYDMIVREIVYQIGVESSTACAETVNKFGCGDCGRCPASEGKCGENCDDCDDCQCVKEDCTLCKNFNLLGGFCKTGEAEYSKECFEKA